MLLNLSGAYGPFFSRKLVIATEGHPTTVETTTMNTEAYRPFPNSFKRRLAAGETLIGCWCSLANPITTEVLGIAGFDWLLLDGEHSPNDVTTFIPQLMALKDSASAPVVRPSSNNAVEIKRLLDAGFYNFLVPFVETVDDARRAVANDSGQRRPFV